SLPTLLSVARESATQLSQSSNIAREERDAERTLSDIKPHNTLALSPHLPVAEHSTAMSEPHSPTNSTVSSPLYLRSTPPTLHTHYYHTIMPR
ncbi:hypothetical protein CHS0354_030272, partial [Potamilus streckersoni]